MGKFENIVSITYPNPYVVSILSEQGKLWFGKEVNIYEQLGTKRVWN